MSAYVSFRQPGEADKPVLLALHGTGGDERQFVELARWIAPGAALVAPRGDVSEHGANRFFRRKAEGVYDMEDLALRTSKMIGFAEEIRAEHPGRPLFAFGYSNGANILASALFGRPELFERAALLHPLIPWTPAPQPGLQDKPIFVSAGRRDPICPLPASLALIEHLRTQGAAVESLIHPGGHEFVPEEAEALRKFLSPA
ncbi:alpha/beta hydrolase [Neomegalonema perideroedes]|uniref:alpha/beta hydrolase n=1 Tax=Neomegalonema perideroedes TaxID=217219 RepID=UPI000382B4A7|nr:alpha/beta hydrolase [Neomegalonema perideroedes]